MNTAPSHLHRKIFDEVRESILAAKYRQGDRLPSDSEFATQFDTSRPTVARAMRDLQTEGFITRRAGGGSYVCKVEPHRGTKEFGLFIPGLGTTDLFEAICGEVVSLVRSHEYGVQWGGLDTIRPDEMSREQVEGLCSQFIQRKVAGVFFIPFEMAVNKNKANELITTRLRDSGIPVVLLDRDLSDFPMRSNYDLVAVDNFLGGYMLGDHMVKLGCRRLAFVAPALSASSVNLRIAGVREAMVQKQINPRPDWVAWGDPGDVSFVRKLVAGNIFDGFICANDYTAAVLLRTFERLKVHVPGDARVTGFDDVRYATLVRVPLTTVYQPCREIAMKAVDTMMQRIAHPELPPSTALLTPRMVVRESCGAYLHH